MAPPSSASSTQAQSGQEEPLKRMEKIVTSLMARPDAAPFLEPVDWRGLELWDYPSVVKRLMDLGTIKRKLDRNQYETAAQCAMDVRQVWRNCMLYNAERSDFWLLAKALSKRFEDRYRKVKAECAYHEWGKVNLVKARLDRGIVCFRFSLLAILCRRSLRRRRGGGEGRG
jgi:Bromodomain